MGAQMGLLLAALVALLCLYSPACGAEGCSGFRHLENGRTFFRYGGLLVIFHCHPDYKLHGYKTNSCVSGHWSRDPPVCVGSGCPSPGLLTHGTSSMNEDGSWAVFSCNSGFLLVGPSMLYCKGHNWNSTRPVCKESDMMSSVSGVSVQKTNIHQDLQAAVVLKTQQQSHYDIHANTPAKEANLKFGLLSHTPSQMSHSERIKVTNPKVHLQQHIQFPSFKVKDGVQTSHREAQLQEANEGPETGAGRHGSEAKDSDEKAEKVDKVTHMFDSKPHLSTTVSSTLSLASGTERSVSSPSFSAAPAPAITTVTDTATSQDYVTPSEVVTGFSQTADEDQQAETGFQYPPASSNPSSTIQSTRKKQIPNVTLPSNTSTASQSRSHSTEHHTLMMNATSKPPLLSLSLSRRPVCPYPPVPAHGTFYFRNVENPGPRVYRHYIQYACYPGYTLAHGDVHSYCQHGGTWSGVTPVCLELTPCSVNNGGCSQLCSHNNQSSNQNQTTTQCHCRPGFTLLDDRQTCRDLDECVERQHRCQQRCINTFGSFMCSCDDGYQLAHDQTSCADVDECLLPAAVTGCVFGCVNTPGSFHCQCPAGYSLQTADSHCQDTDECAVNQGRGPCMEQCHNSPGSYRCSCTYGHILAGDGHSCIAECPPGYKKQLTTPENSTAQALLEECVDVNECQEERCEWQCVNLPGSHRCICPKGYTLHRDGQRCKDINECSRKNGGCSHLCVNQNGGYKCACPPSHRLSPYSWKKCVPRTTANTAG
ncbi:uncharacterized protein AKAME5_000836100 [Lates japonicus]|uniref:Uncharacterized protein n=1 Tax=Lates japonicus TaxID=270547 RepID=A0AAD3MLF8_LATJO|nr:uncharacterized protein AKAME5_000836100 [Lates japonicus]